MSFNTGFSLGGMGSRHIRYNTPKIIKVCKSFCNSMLHSVSLNNYFNPQITTVYK